MQKIFFILSLLALAGCSGLGGGSVVQVNSYSYEVTAKRSNGVSSDLEDATQHVHTVADDFCAKQNGVAETLSLARFEEDLGRPASATLRFRCIKSDKPETPQKPQG